MSTKETTELLLAWQVIQLVPQNACNLLRATLYAVVVAQDSAYTKDATPRRLDADNMSSAEI